MTDPVCYILHESDEVFGWEVVTMTLNHTHHITHVVPHNDLKPHQLDRSCWCNPVEDSDECDLWTHNSADRREEYESRVH